MNIQYKIPGLSLNAALQLVHMYINEHTSCNIRCDNYSRGYWLKMIDSPIYAGLRAKPYEEKEGHLFPIETAEKLERLTFRDIEAEWEFMSISD